MNGGGQVEEGHALREVLGKLGCARRLAVEGEYQSPIEDGEFMFGKEVERDLALRKAFGVLSIQVERPGQTAVQPGRIGVQLDGRAQQLDGFGEAAPAEREHDADAGGPGTVGQMGAEGEGAEGRGQIAVEVEVHPAHRRQDGFRLAGQIRDGLDRAVHVLRSDSWGHEAVEGLSHAEMSQINLGGDQRGIHFDGPQ